MALAQAPRPPGGGAMIRLLACLARLLTRWRYEDRCPCCGARLTNLELDASAPWCWRCNGSGA